MTSDGRCLPENCQRYREVLSDTPLESSCVRIRTARTGTVGASSHGQEAGSAQGGRSVDEGGAEKATLAPVADPNGEEGRLKGPADDAEVPTPSSRSARDVPLETGARGAAIWRDRGRGRGRRRERRGRGHRRQEADSRRRGRVDLRAGRGGQARGRAHRGPGLHPLRGRRRRRARAAGDGGRSDRRPGQGLPEADRQGRPAERRAGGRAREADRGRPVRRREGERRGRQGQERRARGLRRGSPRTGAGRRTTCSRRTCVWWSAWPSATPAAGCCSWT